MLVAEGMGTHMEKGYIYFAMAFSLLVELLNMRYRRRQAVPARGRGLGGERLLRESQQGQREGQRHRAQHEPDGRRTR